MTYYNLNCVYYAIESAPFVISHPSHWFFKKKMEISHRFRCFVNNKIIINDRTKRLDFNWKCALFPMLTNFIDRYHADKRQLGTQTHQHKLMEIVISFQLQKWCVWMVKRYILVPCNLMISGMNEISNRIIRNCLVRNEIHSYFLLQWNFLLQSIGDNYINRTIHMFYHPLKI